jgi:glycosyltransferase involved in cell wall biosynthesis
MATSKSESNKSIYSSSSERLDVFQTDIESGHSKQIQTLRTKFDTLRVENQHLYTQLEMFSDLHYLIFYTLKATKRELRERYHFLRHKLHGFKDNILKQKRSSQNQKNFSSDFKPYQVKIIHPIQERRPRILHVIGNFRTGGSAQLVVDLIEHLGHRFEQEVITKELPDIAGYAGIKIHLFEQFKSFREPLQILQMLQPDIVHIHYLGTHENDWVGRDWKWYDKVFQAIQVNNYSVIENINIPTDPYVSDKVKYYVYVSDYVAREHGHLNSRNVTVYPGSDVCFFSRKNTADFPDDCIGMVYRLDGDKINETAIDVFIKVVQRRSQTKVLIVGGGRLLEVYQDAVKQAGVTDAFTFTGYVSYEQLPNQYEKMSIFIAPVYWESFGQVSPFAMSMGLPVVGYDVGAIHEIVGDRNLLAAPGDSDALADIVIELLEDRERRLSIGSRNRQRARELFSTETMIERYSILYENVLKEARQNA